MIEQVIVQTYASRPDLIDQPLLEPEDDWFIDESSFMLNGEKKARCVVLSYEEGIEAWPLSAGTSTQKAELIALTRALTLRKTKRLNVYTDSTYAFLVLHAYAAIWKERGLLSGRQSPIKHGKEIL
jgi:ribonuclease HI